MLTGRAVRPCLSRVTMAAALLLSLVLPAAPVAAQPPAAAVAATPTPGQSTPSRRPASPARDTPAQRAADASATLGTIRGRVAAADTGRPVLRARVFLSGPGLDGGRATLTDEDGRFTLSDVPAGRYSVTASKAGFVTLAYGQRRPLQPGTPLQLGAGATIGNVEFRLPRGSVITGRVVDESGDVLPGASVRAMRYEFTQGRRQLVAAGAAQTDDRGTYRIWGLMPGDYYVSAVSPSPGAAGGRGPAGGGFPGRGGRPGAAAAGVDVDAVGYAPTFYPGVPSSTEAHAVTVGLSAELTNIDFGVLLVRTLRVSGRVINADGGASSAGSVVLNSGDGATVGRGVGGQYAARINWDGTFEVAGVPPGRYTLTARSTDTADTEFAMQPLTVSDTAVENLTIVLAPAATASGTVVARAAQASAAPDLTQFRLTAPAVDGVDPAGAPTGRPDRDGQFTVERLAPGGHYLRATGVPRGWALASVTVAGRDITDVPFDVRAGQKLTGMRVVFTDQLTELSGTVTDAAGRPVTDCTVLAFPDDETRWHAQSRHIMTARPDQSGRYMITGLPAGSYWLVAIDPTDAGEWFDPTFLAAHRDAAMRVRLTDGEHATHAVPAPAR